jgi:hypothetical protein
MPDDNFITINGANEPCASCQVQPGEPHLPTCTGGMHDVVSLIAVRLSPRRWLLAKRSKELLENRTPVYEAIGTPMDRVQAIVKARDLHGGPITIRFQEES